MKHETTLAKLTRLTQRKASQFEVHELRRILWDFSEVLIEYDLTSEYIEVLKEVRDDIIKRGVS